MPTNLTMTRVAAKLDELFSGKIDLTDIKNPDEVQTAFYSRAIAALALMMRCGVDEDTAVRCITDGYHDMGVDAVYNDPIQKKLILIQSKWRKDGNGGIAQTEAGTFAQGAKRFIDSDFEGCNKKIAAKQTDIIAALKNIDCQVEIIFAIREMNLRLLLLKDLSQICSPKLMRKM